jgi:putative Ca2+/H+ antiporter (TMEM165/GDT1 family)
VFAGRLASEKIPFRLIRIVAATLFALIGLWVLVQGVPASGA